MSITTVFPYIPGGTLYALLSPVSGGFAGEWWRVDQNSYENWTDGSYSNYAVTMTRQGTSKIYELTLPTLAAAAKHVAIVMLQAGGSPAISDTILGQTSINETTIDSLNGGVIVTQMSDHVIVPTTFSNVMREILLDAVTLTGVTVPATADDYLRTVKFNGAWAYQSTTLGTGGAFIWFDSASNWWVITLGGPNGGAVGSYGTKFWTTAVGSGLLGTLTATGSPTGAPVITYCAGTSLPNPGQSNTRLGSASYVTVTGSNSGSINGIYAQNVDGTYYCYARNLWLSWQALEHTWNISTIPSTAPNSPGIAFAAYTGDVTGTNPTGTYSAITPYTGSSTVSIVTSVSTPIKTDAAGYVLTAASQVSSPSGLALEARFLGITYLANWLMLLMRQDSDLETLAEVNATNADDTPGTYDPTLDSLQVIAGSSLVGVGSKTVTYEPLDSTNSPIPQCGCWGSTASGGSPVVFGTVYTNDFGQVQLMLDPGDYYVWRAKSGINFSNPQKITVLP